MAQLVERVLGKDEVPGSNPGSSSKSRVTLDTAFCFLPKNIKSAEKYIYFFRTLFFNIIINYKYKLKRRLKWKLRK